MEVKIKTKNKTFSFSIQEKAVNGITGSHYEELVDGISLKDILETEMTLDGKKLNRDEMRQYKQKIGLVSQEMDSICFRYKVYEYLYQRMRTNRVSLKDPRKKVMDTLKVVGLDVTYLNRDIQDLSSSERKLIQFGSVLMFNPEMIIMINPLEGFDRKTKKRIFSLIQKMKDLYDKTILFVSNQPDLLYQYTDYLIVEKNGILLEGETKEVYQQVDFLKKNKILLPEIVELTDLLRKKGMNIDYHRDLRDLMKDIYKHV
ncbi:MAG: ATP-binding cassette domain-containing protein [Bacilli bacterium]|nr:ATP-binding cassette domain-containing protein [Bacilli bacterium]